MTAMDRIVNILKMALRFVEFCDRLYALASFINLAVFIKQGTSSITQANTVQSASACFQCKCNSPTHKTPESSISPWWTATWYGKSIKWSSKTFSHTCTSSLALGSKMSSTFTHIWGLRIRKINRGACFAETFPLWPLGLSRVAIFAVFIAPKMPKVKRPTVKSVANMLIIGLPSMLDFIYFTLIMPHFWMHLNLTRFSLVYLKSPQTE